MSEGCVVEKDAPVASVLRELMPKVYTEEEHVLEKSGGDIVMQSEGDERVMKKRGMEEVSEEYMNQLVSRAVRSLVDPQTQF